MSWGGSLQGITGVQGQLIAGLETENKARKSQARWRSVKTWLEIGAAAVLGWKLRDWLQ